MAALSRTQDQVTAAMRAVEEADATALEKAEMLMEIAMSMQQKPQAVEDLEAAVQLYKTALLLSGEKHALLSARIRARMATALMATPSEDSALLEKAREDLEHSLGVFAEQGTAEELAEAEMNLGLVLQNLAGMHKAPIQDAISAYQRALRSFDKFVSQKNLPFYKTILRLLFYRSPLTMRKASCVKLLLFKRLKKGSQL